MKGKNFREDGVMNVVRCVACKTIWSCQQFNRLVGFCTNCVREGVECKYAFSKAEVPAILKPKVIDQMCAECFTGGEK